MPTLTTTKAKPFLKWAGGKSQLLPAIDSYLPADFRHSSDVTYIEPFVGGGAMLFFMLQKYSSNIKKAVINDINSHLITTYKVIQKSPGILISVLKDIDSLYKSLVGYDRQKQFYLDIRSRFNIGKISETEEAAFMIFMNRTCFNGLYRENSKGCFNVPFGRYENPSICDEGLIMADSELLQKVEIINGDFSHTESFIDNNTIFYFDPPYRPLDATSSFNSYVKESFDDNEQIRLRDYFTKISDMGCYALLSNSDGRGRNPDNLFFDELYSDYIIERVLAKRCINSNPSKRGTLTELLIRNYKDYQGQKA